MGKIAVVWKAALYTRLMFTACELTDREMLPSKYAQEIT